MAVGKCLGKLASLDLCLKVELNAAMEDSFYSQWRECDSSIQANLRENYENVAVFLLLILVFFSPAQELTGFRGTADV